MTSDDSAQSAKGKKRRGLLKWVFVGLLSLFVVNFFLGDSIRRLLYKDDERDIQELLLSFQRATKVRDYDEMRKCFLPEKRDALDNAKLDSLDYGLMRAGPTHYEIYVGWTRTAGRLRVGRGIMSANQVYYLRRDQTTKRWYFTGEFDNYLD